MAETMGSSLRSSVTSLVGVGSERATQLARLKITTAEELLLHRPHRYEDRRQTRAIRDLVPKEPTLVRGKVVALGIKRFRRGMKSLFELVLDDGTGRLHCQWWNQPYMENYFHQGDEVVAFGKMKSLKPRTMDHPETEVIEAGEELSIHINRVVPIYPLTEGVTQRWLRGLIWRTLPRFKRAFAESARTFPAFLNRDEAVESIHFPNELSDAERGRTRLAFDEFLELQLQMQTRRRNLQKHAQGLPCSGDNSLIKPFLKELDFALTEAQTRVLRELRADMGGQHPMRRLLQGDVGCGKTVVAACCALMAIESGFSVALMAPTEILAEQHFRNFKSWFEPLGIRIDLQTSSQKTELESPLAQLGLPLSNRKGRQRSLLKGSEVSGQTGPRLVIGTHALIEAGFSLEKLGLVIIDEQHKFGVSQREKLVRKGRYPHLLVMTATPIPRTLGLTLYGDLDVSVIDELPPRKGTIRTFVRSPETLPKVWDFIRTELKRGRQAYVVYPRVEETDEGTVKAVMREYEKLQATLAPFSVGLLHGRLRSQEKELASEQFRKGQIQVLLATSIIEVGIDVPNASVMLIENAEQFGLAQLHQLRGRVGRGPYASYCILIAAPRTPEARQRLRVLEQSTDGFKIAEADLKLRGPGELLGQEQSGLPPFRFGNLSEDVELIERARETAKELLATNSEDDHRAAK